MPPKSSSSRKISKGNNHDKVKKRSCNACVRCRAQKIKCSGSQPCEACKKRKLSCLFDDRDQKILVTKGYIIDLQQRVRGTQRGVAAHCTSPDHFLNPHDMSVDSPQGSDDIDQSEIPESSGLANESSRPHEAIQLSSVLSQPMQALEPDRTTTERQRTVQPLSIDGVASTITNPLSTGPSKYIKSSDGNVHYLGTSSNWSFTRRVLSLAQEYVKQNSVSTDMLLFDSSAYDLGWDGLRVMENLKSSTLPSLDYAIYLVNAVKFHCTQIYHLFDDTKFMVALHDFYADPSPKITMADLSYIHLLVILALGKALVEKNIAMKRPPGAELFVKAMQLLPNIHALTKSPLLSTEILCCIALYFQSLDFRASAYTLIGQAMRVAMTHGMHSDMPTQHLGEEYVERCRRIWWTVYIMDREMASLMGVPPSIHDDDIQTKMPNCSRSTQETVALKMQIRLSQTIARINRGVYGVDGRLNKKFLTSTKETLGDIASFADELREQFSLQIDKSAITGLSRISGYLHLLYHQCIILATRPLLLCFLKIRLESPSSYATELNSSKTVWNLLKMCLESSQQIVSILTELQNQGLLETFLPFNLEPLSVAMVNILVASALDPRLVENSSAWLDKSEEILKEIICRGNSIAEFRKTEADLLKGILSDMDNRLPAQSQRIVNSSQIVPSAFGTSQNRLATALPQNETSQDVNSSWRADGLDFLDLPNLDVELTTAQITEMANSIANSDTEWMQYAITEHGIW